MYGTHADRQATSGGVREQTTLVVVVVLILGVGVLVAVVVVVVAVVGCCGVPAVHNYIVCFLCCGVVPFSVCVCLSDPSREASHSTLQAAADSAKAPGRCTRPRPPRRGSHGRIPQCPLRHSSSWSSSLLLSSSWSSSLRLPSLLLLCTADTHPSAP